MVNKVTLIGRLGRDPEVRAVGATSVTNFSIATDEKYTDKAGTKQERTEWHNIVAWGKLGEICARYLNKGKLVFIEGSIRTEAWEKNGEKKSKTTIVAHEMKMLGDRDGGSRSASPAQSAPAQDDEEVPF